MTATATADSALATHRPSVAACSRYALIVAVLVPLAGAGFAAARSLAESDRTRPAPVCFETCGPLSTTGGDETDGLGDAVDPRADVGVPKSTDTATNNNREEVDK